MTWGKFHKTFFGIIYAAVNALPQVLTCGLCYKSFTIVIYDRNAIGQYYKTTIVVGLTMSVAKAIPSPS